MARLHFPTTRFPRWATRVLAGAPRWAATLVLAALVSACATARPPHDLAVTAESVKPSWQPPGRARLQAREEAVARARQMLWDSILAEKVAVPAGGAAGEVTVEYLVVTNPAFESSLWAMVGRLQPIRVEDRPNGEVAVQLETDRREALALAADYAARMRREGRL